MRGERGEGSPYQIREYRGEDPNTRRDIEVKITNQQPQLVRGNGSHGPDVWREEK